MAKMKIAESVNILGFDPSTDITAAALVRFFPHGEPELLDSIAIDARASCKGEGLANRLVRIRWTREQLYDWLNRMDHRIDAIAFEPDTGRGFGASEALKFATGAYLSLPHLAIQTLESVSRQKACKAVGCLREYAAPRGNDPEAKTLMLKTAVRVACSRFFPDACLMGPVIDAEEKERLKAEAIADSLAICMGAGNDWIEAQRVLHLPKQPKLAKARKSEVAE